MLSIPELLVINSLIIAYMAEDLSLLLTISSSVIGFSAALICAFLPLQSSFGDNGLLLCFLVQDSFNKVNKNPSGCVACLINSSSLLTLIAAQDKLFCICTQLNFNILSAS